MSRGKDGFGKRLLFYRASAQICMVSASGTLLKRLGTSKEERKAEEGEKIKFLTSFTLASIYVGIPLAPTNGKSI